MKKLPLLLIAILTGLMIIIIKHQSGKIPNDHRILEANLYQTGF